MSEWKEYTLDEVYDFSGGLSKPRSEFGFGFEFLSYKDVYHNYFIPDKLTELVNSSEKERRKCSIKRGDVFLTRTSETQDELGMSCVALKNYPDATFNGFTKRLRPNGIIEILPEYAGFYFRSPRFRATVSMMASMTTRASLNNDMMASLSIIVPSIVEQKAIAKTLLCLNKKIDLLQRQNATLEGMAEALFREWFVERVGEDWEDGILNDLVEFNYGKALSKNRRSGSGFPVYGSSGVVGYHSKYLVEGPGIITGRKGTLGVINYSFENFFPIDTTFFITSKTKSQGLYFEFFLIKSLGLGKMNTDSAVPGLNRNLAHSIKIKVPPEPLRNNFNEVVTSQFVKIRTNLKQLETLEKLRDNLLPKLMSGEIRIKMN